VITCAPAPLERHVAKHFDDMLASARPQIRAVVEKRKDVMRYLDSVQLAYLPGEPTFYLFVSIAPTALDSDTFATQLLEEYAVSVVPGIGYGASCDRFVRISVGAEPLESIFTGIDRLRELVDRTAGGSGIR
jgi:aspartate aminotransferase/aminotransferase